MTDDDIARLREHRPVAWGVRDLDPKCECWLHIAETRDMAYDHIKDAAVDPQLAVMSRTWVVRPLYAAPQPAAPVVDDDIARLRKLAAALQRLCDDRSTKNLDQWDEWAVEVSDEMVCAAEYAHDEMREQRGLVGGFCRDAVPAMLLAAMKVGGGR